MLETIRRYWIGLLVIVLVGLHASIVGIIRYQASLAKVDASCEVDLGSYLAYQIGKKSPLQMRIHAIVPLNHRMKSRQLIELNQAQVRQSIEEYLRQLDSKVLVDPYLADLKSQLLEVMIQTIGDSSIDDLVVTEVRESSGDATLEFVSKGPAPQPRRLVATLRDPSQENEENEESLTAADLESHADETEHAEPEAKPHAAPAPKASSHGAESSHGKPAAHGAASSHGKPAAHGAASSHGKPAGHGATAKKPSSSGAHGAAKKPAAAAHGGGHGAAAPKAKSGH